MSTKNQPLSGNAMPRFAGPGTMMRLPAATSPVGLDAAFIGVPLDIGTSITTGIGVYSHCIFIVLNRYSINSRFSG